MHAAALNRSGLCLRVSFGLQRAVTALAKAWTTPAAVFRAQTPSRSGSDRSLGSSFQSDAALMAASSFQNVISSNPVQAGPAPTPLPSALRSALPPQVLYRSTLSRFRLLPLPFPVQSRWFRCGFRFAHQNHHGQHPHRSPRHTLLRLCPDGEVDFRDFFMTITASAHRDVSSAQTWRSSHQLPLFFLPAALVLSPLAADRCTCKPG